MQTLLKDDNSSLFILISFIPVNNTTPIEIIIGIESLKAFEQLKLKYFQSLFLRFLLKSSISNGF